MKATGFRMYSMAILAGLILFIPFLGGVHLFDWDEINFAESAREMIASGNYLTVQINYEPFWEKPPLFIWMQVLSMKLFGLNEFAARFPNAIAGILTLLVVLRVGRKIMEPQFGTIWMLAYIGSFLPFFYFKSGIIDPWFNLFIFLGITHFAYYFIFSSARRRNLCLSAFFIGLAILTKGPVALLILILSFVVFLLLRVFRIQTHILDVVLFILVLVVTGGFWFILQIFDGNYDIIQDFITYQIRLFRTQDAGHGGFFMYHFVVLFFGVFPASIFALPVIFRRTEKQERSREYSRWMKILFWTVLILFSIVKTKIIHYSSLCYFPLTYLAAMAIYRMERREIQLKNYQRGLILFVGLIWGSIVTILPLIQYFKSVILEKGWIDDPFAEANLQANVQWLGWESAIGLLFMGILVYLVGFRMKKNKLLIRSLFGLSAVFIYLTILFITPRVEGYTQRTAIEFYKEFQKEDVYVATLGFKSYAHLYYSRVQPYSHENASETEWLLNGEIDKPAYFVFKITKKEQYLNRYPQLELLYEKNGFVFTKRKTNDQ